MKRPQITQGHWLQNSQLQITAPAPNGLRYNVADCVTGINRSEEEKQANARAIAAIPAILSALESAYLRACDYVRRIELHGENFNDKMDVAVMIRDEYKAALQAAGYTFNEPGEPDPANPEPCCEPECGGFTQSATTQCRLCAVQGAPA